MATINSISLAPTRRTSRINIRITANSTNITMVITIYRIMIKKVRSIFTTRPTIIIAM